MRKQTLIALTVLATLTLSVPAHAATVEAGSGSTSSSTAKKTYKANVDPDINWILNPDTYKDSEHDGHSWWQMEGVEQARKWANDNKGDIESIADEKERYTAIVNKVCDFLTYDLNYVQPHIAYTIRDGKGVCSDYTSLTKALCDANDIYAQVSEGVAYGDTHDMLKVTISGHEYYSDPTGVDSGACDILMDSTPSYYTEQTIHDDLLSATAGTGYSVSQNSDDVKGINAPKVKYFSVI